MDLEIDEWNKKTSEITERENNANKLLKNLSERNDSLINSKKDLNRELEDKSNEIEKLCIKIANLEKESSSLKELILSNEEKILETNQINQGNLDLIESLENTVSEKANEIIELKKKITKLNCENEDLKNDIQYKQNEADKLNHEIERQRVFIEEMKSKAEKAEEEKINSLKNALITTSKSKLKTKKVVKILDFFIKIY